MKLIPLVLISAAVLVGCAGDPLREVPPQITEVKNPTGRPVIQKVEVKDFIMYSAMSCTAHNTEKCGHERHLKAPEGWQACLPLFTITTGSGANGVAMTAEDWYTNDPEKPDRFRGFFFRMWATGGGFGGAGADIRVANIGIRGIPATATNSDRYDVGCQMPPH